MIQPTEKGYDFKPTLAKYYHEEAHKVKYPCVALPKLDGVRAILKDGVFTSRDNNVWPSYMTDHIDVPDSDIPIDGEFYRHGWKCWRINGAMAVKRREPSEDTYEIGFHAFDSITPGNFVQRIEVARDLGHNVVPYKVCQTEQEILDLHLENINQGYEGTMVRNGHAPYEHKRTDNLLKMKDFIDAEFKCVGIREGKGKHKGRVGAIELINENGDEFRCGGFEDEHRDRMWLNPSLIIGKAVTVKFFEYTTKGVPRHPSFVSVRDYE